MSSVLHERVCNCGDSGKCFTDIGEYILKIAFFEEGKTGKDQRGPGERNPAKVRKNYTNYLFSDRFDKAEWCAYNTDTVIFNLTDHLSCRALERCMCVNSRPE